MQKEKSDLKDAFKQHKIALNKSLNAPEEETLAHRAVATLFDDIERQDADLEAPKVHLTLLIQKLTQKAPSVFYENSDEKLNAFPATILTDTIGISI